MAQTECVSVEIVAIGSRLCASDEIFKIDLALCVFHFEIVKHQMSNFKFQLWQQSKLMPASTCQVVTNYCLQSHISFSAVFSL